MRGRQADNLIALRGKLLQFMYSKVVTVNIGTEAFCDPVRNNLKVDMGFACSKHDAPRQQFEAGGQSIYQRIHWYGQIPNSCLQQ